MSRRIFVLDSTGDSRAALERLLVNRGFSVCASGAWEEAAEILEREPLDLLMADSTPPAEDFLEAILVIHARFPVLPIFLVTSFSQNEREIEKVRPVCRCIFEKPLDLGAMDRALGALFAVA